MDQKKPPSKPYNMTQVGLIIGIVYGMGLLFNSEGLKDWLNQNAHKSYYHRAHGNFAGWNHSMTNFTFHLPRQNLKAWFHAHVPLQNQDTDALGFNEKDDPEEEPSFGEPTVYRPKVFSTLHLSLGTRDEVITESMAESLPDIIAQESSDFSPANVGKILVIGDSIMGGIAPQIKRALRQTQAPAPTIHWKTSSGLVREDYYNWPKVVKHILKDDNPEYAVVLFGTNDPGKPIRLKTGKRVAYHTTGWRHAYKDRVRALVDILCHKVKTVYWLTLPPMRRTALHQDALFLNGIYRDVAEETKNCTQIVETKPIVGNDEGAYTTYRTFGTNRLKIRARDGIHMTPDGGKIVATYILNLIDIDQQFSMAH